jgi:hypothetical protein
LRSEARDPLDRREHAVHTSAASARQYSGGASLPARK